MHLKIDKNIRNVFKFAYFCVISYLVINIPSLMCEFLAQRQLVIVGRTECSLCRAELRTLDRELQCSGLQAAAVLWGGAVARCSAALHNSRTRQAAAHSCPVSTPTQPPNLQNVPE